MNYFAADFLRKLIFLYWPKPLKIYIPVSLKLFCGNWHLEQLRFDKQLHFDIFGKALLITLNLLHITSSCSNFRRTLFIKRFYFFFPKHTIFLSSHIHLKNVWRIFHLLKHFAITSAETELVFPHKLLYNLRLRTLSI